ncbi:hypothetical protein JAAARDRAFT_207161 [Jaapia argillacea MUCL 33604]|uniref:Clathrin/coatomer adaptor adaptin-like N-terminal domain-containing protein n=1 Tax=Jaapia argillacea MUCL 33604 TaxID=933084 RepID=A0A067Q2F2_9AGAM|nr:hypothetical protein JAAARDRAFT_207161 [Jaapia argillacea MUCL 33604]
MDVPFTSSGAMSRAHYAFVRKVENCSTSQLADQYINVEVETIHSRLASPTLSLKQCKEYLVLLLYCSTTLTSPLERTLDFALPHAIHLADAGQTTADKRLGYLFCTEMMPPDSDLNLMLVNTLRKDLESHSEARTCLALDTIIQHPFQDVIPAIQSRLRDLLSNNSLHVRRRALLAFRALSSIEPEVLTHIADKLPRRLKDTQPIVISAALSVALARSLNPPEISKLVNELLKPSWEPGLDRSEYWFVLRVLFAFRTIKPSTDNLRLVTDIARWAAKRNVKAHAVLLESFSVFSSSKTELLALVKSMPSLSPARSIRHLITSEDPNEHYLVLSCLEFLDVALWAGTDSEIPSVLDAWEVERVMMFLESRDEAIRKKTLRLLNSVDSNIVESYLSQVVQTTSGITPLAQKNEFAARVLEVIEVACQDDGERYARRLREFLCATEDETSAGSGAHVLEKVVEIVLLRVRTAQQPFRVSCVKELLGSLHTDSLYGPTLMVILAALACEYASVSSAPSESLLSAMAGKLSSYSASIQDACLLCMIRIAGDCDGMPSDVLENVRSLLERAGRHIRRRCQQFIDLSEQHEVIRRVIDKAQSSSLPDFLLSLEAHSGTPLPTSPLPRSPPTQRQSLRSPDPSSSQSLAASKLRYAAYEPPPVAPRLRRPRSQQSYNTLSTSSSRSATYSDHGSVVGSPRLSAERAADDVLSRTVTAGDLALVAGDPDLRGGVEKQSAKPGKPLLPLVSLQMLDESHGSRADLIAFDSPFITEPESTGISANPGSTKMEPEFESTWNSLEKNNLRGWCEISVDTVTERLQSLGHPIRCVPADEAPFEGEIKILVVADPDKLAALRLRGGEDQSCLWRLRCNDVELQVQVKRVLSED